MNAHLCMICKDNFINITFDPCGHSVVCESCALGLLMCPICRKGIALLHRSQTSISNEQQQQQQQQYFHQYTTYQHQQYNNPSIGANINNVSRTDMMPMGTNHQNPPLQPSSYLANPSPHYQYNSNIQQHGATSGMNMIPTVPPQQQKLGVPDVQCNSNGLSKYYDESQRFKTFFTWPRDAEVQPLALVKAGFFYTEKNDIVQCCMCGLVVRDWRRTDDPLQIHVSRRSNCPFLQKNPHIIQKLGCGVGSSLHPTNNNNTMYSSPFIAQQQDYLAYGNQPTVKNLHVVGADDGGVGVGMTPHHHHIASSPVSYQTRPQQHYHHHQQQQQHHRQLPSYIDRFQSPSNMIPPYNLQPPHNMKTADTNNRRPTSPYQQQPQNHQNHQGESIGRYNNTTTTVEYSPTSPSSSSSSSSSLHNKMKTHCQSLVGAPHDDGGGKSCGDSIDPSLQQLPLHLGSAADILEIHNRNKERARLAYEQDIKHQNGGGGRRNSGKNNMNSFCKICEDNPVTITFVPCGHLVVCESCALGLLMCPMCRKGIDKTIRTFFYGN